MTLTRLFSSLLFLSLFSRIAYALTVKSDVHECYQKQCSDGTFACKKHTYLVEEKEFLQTDIYCLDREGGELDSFHEKVQNPFDRRISFDGYSYTSVFIIQRDISTSTSTTPATDVEVF